MDPRLNPALLKSVVDAIEDIVDGIRSGIDIITTIIDSDFSLKDIVDDFLDAFRELPNNVSQKKAIHISKH